MGMLDRYDYKSEEERKFWQRLTHDESILYTIIQLDNEIVAYINKSYYLSFSTDTRAFGELSFEDRDRIVQLCIKVSQGAEIEDLRV